MHKQTLLLLVGIATAACSYGTRIAAFRPAQTPYGVSASINTAQTQLSGELIEVRDAGLVLLTVASNKLRLVPYAAVRSSRFEQVGSRIKDGRAPDTVTRERLRLVSRFPQGMSPQVLETMLKASGQTELLGIQP